MKKQNFLFSAIAALALVIFSFSGCDSVLSEGKPDAALGDVSHSTGTVQADLTDTKWLGNIDNVYGVTLIEFTSSTTATGTLGATTHEFKYNLVDPVRGDYSLTEPGTTNGWTFNIN